MVVIVMEMNKLIEENYLADRDKKASDFTQRMVEGELTQDEMDALNETRKLLKGSVDCYGV
jgi:hypothetical protein